MKNISAQTKKQKLNYILDIVNEIDISAYEISNNTNLTEAGIARVLKGTVKNPHESTLNEIISYFDKILVTPANNIADVSKPTHHIEIKNLPQLAIELQEQIGELEKIIGLLNQLNQPCDHQEEMIRLKEYQLELVLINHNNSVIGVGSQKEVNAEKIADIDKQDKEVL